MSLHKNTGFIVAAEMGMGKTLAVLKVIRDVKQESKMLKVLLVVPVAVMSQ
jgi:SNF2 family DNA or RNA helicase